MIAGVDGAGDQWVIALLRGNAVSWAVAQHAAAVLEEVGGCAAVGVDVPIGLPEQGPRRCDLEARRRLGRAAASIFHAPIRAVLDATSHREACAALRQRGEAGMTIYTWGIVPKIRQWDALSSMVDIGAVLATAPERVALDDALDALAAAWSARRWAAGRAETLGGELDRRNRLMRIVV